MRHRFAALALCGLLLLLSGCGEQMPDATQSPEPTPTPSAQPTAVLATQFALPCYPDAGFHPISGTNRVNLELAGLMYDGLYTLDENFQAQPALAASHTVSADSATWTITLRQGVTFSDGSPLTAQDVVYSLNLARQSTLYQYRLSSINGITAGDGTVTITLSLPNGALDTLLDVPILKESTAAVPPGTGPYVLEGTGNDLSLRRRDESWRATDTMPETIRLRAISGNDALISSFDTGDISLVNTDLTGTNSPGFSGNYETTDYATSTLLYVGFNTASGPCQDAAVRRALSYAMDRNTITRAILAHHATPSPLPVHPDSTLYDEELATRLSYAPQTTAQLLEEAGWTRSGGSYSKNGSALEVKLLVSQDNAYRCDVADELERQLESVGVSVTVDKRPWEEYLTALSGGDFDLYLGETRLTADFTFAPLLSGGSLNYGQFSDWTTTTLHATFRAAQGEARNTAATALYEQLEQQMPFTALCFKNSSVLSQWGQISELTPTQQNLYYGFGSWVIHTAS